MSTEVPKRFPNSRMMALTDDHSVRYDLAESVVTDLMISNPIFDERIGNTRDLENPQDISLGYGTSQGSIELRSAIANVNEVDADDVVVTVGGMHALFLCGLILCNERSHLLVANPMFPLARQALSLFAGSIEQVGFSFDNDYQLDVDTLINQLRPETTIVYLASPQNPSGVAIPQERIEALLAAMRRRSPNAFLIMDETYRQASYGNDEIVPSLAATDSQVVSIASLSKCHGAPGLRIGWAITKHPALKQQIINGKFHSVISNSKVDEALAITILQRSDALQKERALHLQEAVKLVERWVSKHSARVDWVKPDAGALCCLRLNPRLSNSDVVQKFHSELNARSVRVAPGQWFGDELQVFRLGFGLLTIKELQAALEAMSQAIEVVYDNLA